MGNEENILYRGTITFTHSVIWLCVLCITFGAIYFALPPLIELFGGDFVFPTIVGISSISFAIGISLPILLLAIKLKIKIRKDGIHLKIVPFHFSYRRISWDDLVNYSSYEVNQKEINRMGIRETIAGRSYSLGGKRGIKLEFADGKMIFIESRRPEKIIEAIKTVVNKHNL
jgi:glyoxylase-like metal-dependent hydrolase (beta-lactamase superfamily II)